MTFITFPLFLGGLAAATIPVILHLLMRGKPRRIEFPALQFVKKRLEVNRRRHRLKHLILLTLRILLFALFGLALARPVLKMADWFPNLAAWSAPSSGQRNFVSTLATSLSSQEAPIAAAVVIDNSLRMEYVAENQNRLEVAKDFARWILTQLPSGSRIAVLSTEREAAVFQVDALAAGDKIERLPIVTDGRKVVEAVRDALMLLSGSDIEQRELYVLTDLSEPGWPGESAFSVQNLVDGMKSSEGLFAATGKELGMFIVDVGVEHPTDSAILGLTLSSQTATPRSTVHLEAELTHLGSAASKTVELLLSDPSPEKTHGETVRDTKTVDFPEGESQRRLTFVLTGFEPGVRQGRLRFTVPDALTVDDQRSFTVQVQAPKKVLLSAQPPVRDSSLFLRQALETVPFEVETESLDELPGKTAKELQRYKAVFLLDPSPLEPVVWKKLADYASGGGGVGVFLGPHANSLEALNDSSAAELLGAKLVRQARNSSGELWIVPGGGVSPILSPFRQVGALDRFPWDAQPVFRYWETTDLSPRAEIALPYSDGRAAVITQAIGRGRTATITTPVSQRADAAQSWNALPYGEGAWMFLLLVEGIAKYLTGAAEQRFNFQAGEKIVIRPDQTDSAGPFPATCLLGTPSEKSIRLTPDTQLREIPVPPLMEPGNYRIRSGGTQESLDAGFSVNLSGDDMILRRIGRERLDSLIGEKNYRLVRTPQEVEHGIARRRVGQELYTTVLIMLAIVFATEYVFSNRFYGRESTSN